MVTCTVSIRFPSKHETYIDIPSKNDTYRDIPSKHETYRSITVLEQYWTIVCDPGQGLIQDRSSVLGNPRRAWHKPIISQLLQTPIQIQYWANVWDAGPTVGRS